MIRRLILLLLMALAAVPTPAMAGACHREPERHASGHGQPPADEDAAPSHACVGCVPPGDWLRERVAAPAPSPDPAPATRVSALALGRGTPPALPPPRTA